MCGTCDHQINIRISMHIPPADPSESNLTVDFSFALPPEIWERVFEHVSDSQILVNCCRTCKAWDQILTLRKPQFLFPLVSPHLQKYFTISDLQNCRSVCKEWKQSAETSLQLRTQQKVSTFLRQHGGHPMPMCAKIWQHYF